MEKNIYTREKDAITLETQLLHLISESLYKASLAEDLLTLRRVLFELELYQKKNQNLSALYAETFNRCFTTAKQVNNPLYLIDKRFITKPLSNLPHAIAREVIDQSSQPH